MHGNFLPWFGPSVPVTVMPLGLALFERVSAFVRAVTDEDFILPTIQLEADRLEHRGGHRLSADSAVTGRQIP